MDDLLNDRRRPPQGEIVPLGYEFKAGKAPFTVAEPCSSKEGRWYCVRHNAAPNYQADAESHATRACQWAWVCMKHIKNGVVETVKQKGWHQWEQ